MWWELWDCHWTYLKRNERKNTEMSKICQTTQSQMRTTTTTIAKQKVWCKIKWEWMKRFWSWYKVRQAIVINFGNFSRSLALSPPPSHSHHWRKITINKRYNKFIVQMERKSAKIRLSNTISNCSLARSCEHTHTQVYTSGWPHLIELYNANKR